MGRGTKRDTSQSEREREEDREREREREREGERERCLVSKYRQHEPVGSTCLALAE